VHPQTVLSNKSGFTLIEVVVAMGIMLVGLLGLLATANLAMDFNTRDYMRDEAVRVGERFMNLTRNADYDSIAAGTTNQPFTSTIRGVSKTYNVTRTVEQLTNTKHVSIVVNWTYKGQNYFHGVDSVVTQ
jgi:type IV pilus assembly protein PilV